MSLTISTDVFCDGPGDGQGAGCMTWTAGVTGATSDAHAARRAARGRGWKRPLVNGRRLDLCPDCAKVLGPTPPGRPSPRPGPPT